MEFETVPRFFVLQWIEKYLFQWGFSDAAADLITFLVACGLFTKERALETLAGSEM